MTAANCEIIIFGQFNAFFTTLPSGRGMVSCQSRGGSCHLAILAFAPKTKILLLYT